MHQINSKIEAKRKTKNIKILPAGALKIFFHRVPKTPFQPGSEKDFCITLLKNICVSYMFSSGKVFNMTDEAPSSKMFQS